MKNTKNAGFTLIELLLVLAVLGILASIAIPRLANVQNKAHDTKIAVVADNIKIGLEAYNQNKNQYPAESTINNEWNKLDDLLTNVELGEMSKYNIKTFNYSRDTKDNYKIEVDSNSSGKTYIITSNNFEKEN